MISKFTLLVCLLASFNLLANTSVELSKLEEMPGDASSQAKEMFDRVYCNNSGGLNILTIDFKNKDDFILDTKLKGSKASFADSYLQLFFINGHSIYYPYPSGKKSLGKSLSDDRDLVGSCAKRSKRESFICRQLKLGRGLCDQARTEILSKNDFSTPLAFCSCSEGGYNQSSPLEAHCVAIEKVNEELYGKPYVITERSFDLSDLTPVGIISDRSVTKCMKVDREWKNYIKSNSLQ